MTLSEIDNTLRSNEQLNRLAEAIAQRLRPKIDAAIQKHVDTCPLASGQTGTFRGAMIAAIAKCPISIAIIVSAIILRHGLEAVLMIIGA